MMYVSLHRTQILLEPWQHARLKELARERRITLSDLVRQMVARGLEEEYGPPKRLLSLAQEGGVADGEWDVDDLDDLIYKAD